MQPLISKLEFLPFFYTLSGSRMSDLLLNGSRNLETWFSLSNRLSYSFDLQPLDVILAQDHNQIVALLEYVRYDFRPQIQKLSIKIMSILGYPFCSQSNLLI